MKIKSNCATGSRIEGIVYDKNFLILGEYGEYGAADSAKIALINHNTCVVYDFYNHLSGVVHIHSIHRHHDSEILVSTGDTKKLLDLWVVDANELKFKRRIKKRLAGYTAACKVCGKDFFGTDFSGRPNYIETLDGKKYFFPLKAYRMFVVAFYTFFDRYIVSINSEMSQFGARKTLSILDTAHEKFIFCEYLERLQKKAGQVHQ